ncbi:MAG TPA: class I SAM-dependent methyltransferase, partial [Promineifilum sp.]
MTLDQKLAEQHRTSANLDVRIDIHERFSTNKYPWHRWVFDHFEFPEACRVVEIGCGTGKLWLENSSRIGAAWNITLSDFSAGVLEAAQTNLANVRGKFDFKVLNVESIPF